MTTVKDKIELIGIVAVVVSLLILGYEIRQNTDTSAAQAIFELNESARQTLFREATDPELVSLIRKAEQDFEDLSERERYMYGRWVFAHLNLFESAWRYRRRGVISDAEMKGWEAAFCGYMARASFRRVVQSVESFTPEFSEESAQWCD
jgi:hypothetical protein